MPDQPSPFASLPLSEEDKLFMSWKELPQSMSVPRSEFAVTVVENNKIFVAGGCNSAAGTTLSSAEIYNLETETWTELPEMPTPCCGCAAVAVGNKIIVMGGIISSQNGSHGLNRVEMFNLSTQEWTSLASMSNKRYGCTAVVLENQIIVLGGDSVKGYGGQSSVEKYNMDTKKWESISPMSTQRAFCSAVVEDNKIHVFGGGHQRHVPTEVFDGKTGSWTAPSLPSFPFQSCEGAAVAIGKQILLLGGTDAACKLDRVDLLDTETGSCWVSLPHMIQKRGCCGAVFVQDQVFVLGGVNENNEYPRSMERMVVDNKMHPEFPVLPPLPNVLGWHERKTALKQWEKEVNQIKIQFLEKIGAKQDKVELCYERCESRLNVLKDLNQIWREIVDDHLRSANQQVATLERRLKPPGAQEDGPVGHLICPITSKIMKDPVVAGDGHTYERAAIEGVFAQTPEDQDVCSPATGGSITHRILIPNMTVLVLVHDYQSK